MDSVPYPQVYAVCCLMIDKEIQPSEISGVSNALVPILDVDSVHPTTIKLLFSVATSSKKLLCADTLMLIHPGNKYLWKYTSPCCIVGANITAYEKVLEICTGYRHTIDIMVLHEKLSKSHKLKYLCRYIKRSL